MVKRCLASEQQDLMALMEWARLKDIPLVHHALERRCDARSGAILKKMGVSKGFPDIALYEARGGYFSLFIELKKKCTYSPSQMNTPTWKAQREWLTRLATEHYYAVMCFGLDEAIRVIETYMSWPHTPFLSLVNENA